MPVATIPVRCLSDLLEGLDHDDRQGDGLLSTVRRNFKMLMEVSLELDRTAQLGRARHERKPGAGHRNGYYLRDLETGFGLIRHLRVPRLREGSLHQDIFERYQRRRADVERAISELYFAGVSTRGVSQVIEILYGFSPSASTVSRILAGVDKELKAFHSRPLGDDFIYLFLDGLTVTLKEAPGANKRLVLVAYGITTSGRRVLIDFKAVNSESREEWERFLLSLRQRGLVGANLRMIIADGGLGVRGAAADAYPETPCQLCWVHKLRNVTNKLHHANMIACLRGARKIYLASNRREAIRAYQEWRDAWERVEPKAVECLARDLEALLTFFRCPVAHRTVVRTTNYIERLIREIRRRTKPIGAFANKMSCERLLYGAIRNINRRWTEHKPLPGFTQNT